MSWHNFLTSLFVSQQIDCQMTHLLWFEIRWVSVDVLNCIAAFCQRAWGRLSRSCTVCSCCYAGGIFCFLLFKYLFVPWSKDRCREFLSFHWLQETLMYSAFWKALICSADFRARTWLFQPFYMSHLLCLQNALSPHLKENKWMLKFKHLSKCIQVNALNQAQRYQILPHEGRLLLVARLTEESCGLYFQQPEVYSVPFSAVLKLVK